MSATKLGTATATKTGSTAPFLIEGKTVTCQVARDLTIASGDVCLLVKVDSEWFALQRLYTAAPSAPSNPTLPDPKPSSVSGTLVVPPVETRSWREADSTWRTADDDVIQGAYGVGGNHRGCAFYGTVPQSLAGATVTSAAVLLRRPLRGGVPAGQALTLRLVTETTRPSGAPTMTSTTAGPSPAWGDEQTFTIPTAWATAMVAGTSGALAVYESDGAPLVVLSGRGDYSAAMSLTINWSR